MRAAAAAVTGQHRCPFTAARSGRECGLIRRAQCGPNPYWARRELNKKTARACAQAVQPTVGALPVTTFVLGARVLPASVTAVIFVAGEWVPRMCVVAHPNCAERRRRGGCVLSEPVKGSESLQASITHDSKDNGIAVKKSKPLSVR